MTLSPRTKTRLLLGTAGLMLSTISPALAYETCSILDLEPGEVCSPGTRDDNDTYVSSAYSTTWNGLLVSGYSGVSDNARSFLWDLKTGEITTIPLTPESGTTFALGHYMSLNGKTSAYREYTTGINDDAIGIVYDWENDLRYETPLLDPNGSARSIYLSGDGRTSFTSATDPSGFSHLFYLDLDEGEWHQFESIREDATIAYMSAVSYDGTVAAGTDVIEDDYSTRRAFLWRKDVWEATGEVTPFDGFGDFESYSSEISRDGTAVYVTARRADNTLGLLRYDILDTGDLIPTQMMPLSETLAVTTFAGLSGNGKIAVGGSYVDGPEETGQRAVYWDADGTVHAIPVLTTAVQTNLASALAASYSGDVIVGRATTSPGYSKAFVWTAETGTEQLADLTETTSSSIARSISDDGTIIIGSAWDDYDNDPGTNDTSRAVVWRNGVQDLGNMLASYPARVADTEAAIDQHQRLPEQLMAAACPALLDGGCARVGGLLARTGADGDLGAQTDRMAMLSYGFGLAPGLTLGGALHLATSEAEHSQIDADNSKGASLWASYAPAATGLRISAAVGYADQDVALDRGDAFDYVMIGNGDSSLTSTAASATVGYGMALPTGWTLTPRMGLTHITTDMDAYEETGSDFNASWDSATLKRTSATVGLDGSYQISPMGRLTLGLDLIHDLDADPLSLTGTIDAEEPEPFTLTSALERNDTRAAFSLGYVHTLANAASISGTLRMGQPTFGDSLTTSFAMEYALNF
nr:autotransporter domain-containing protein [uncultured Celeribacter sp.]